MEIVSEVNWKTHRSYQDHLVISGPKLKIEADSCDHSKPPQKEQNSNGDGIRSQFEDAQVISEPFVTIWNPKMTKIGPKYPKTIPNDPEITSVS